MTNVNPPWLKIQNTETHVVSVRVEIPLLKDIDKWRNRWRGRERPNRSEAIRYMLEQFLNGDGK